MNTIRSRVSPQVYARTAGALYLVVIVLGAFAYGYVPGKLTSAAVVDTANNILAHQLLWRLGIVAALTMVACAIAQLLCEYLLLRPVQRSITLLAVFFNLLSLAIESLGALGYIAALLILQGRDSLKSLGVHQLRVWASVAIDLHDKDLNVSFVFFGATCLLYGYLIFRSRFLPRLLGGLMALAGLCYAANSILEFLGVRLGPAGFPWLLLPAGVSELCLCLWLLIVGVDASKWYAWTDRATVRAP